MSDEPVALKFAKLQRATVTLEIGCALGDNKVIEMAVGHIDQLLSEIKLLLNKGIGNDGRKED